jgi:uncharacterized protein involved in response to NO
MALLNIQESASNRPFSVFVLGFRPFFLAAGLIAVISMASWMAVYSLGLRLPLENLAPQFWHAHEMIFGFVMAVVAGFLLTAVRNWTGVQTLQYRGLMWLTALWAGARICFLFGTEFILLAAILDVTFNFLLAISLLLPVVRVKQWMQAGILSKIVLLGICNLVFYLGVFGFVEKGMFWGLNGALFLLLALVLTMGRRVMPMFIQNGVKYPVKLKNSTFLDMSSLVLLLGFAVSEVFFSHALTSSVLAAALFTISSIRLYNWHTRGIWSAPLLWGLYGAFVFLTFGFLLFALMPYSPMITRSIAIHVFTVGGFALITLSMMSRVTLGHTGRDVLQPARWTWSAQLLIVTGALVRTLCPMLLPAYYSQWILISQVMWIIGFLLFVIINYSFLTRPRVDGAQG